MSKPRFEIHLTLWRDGDTVFVTDDLLRPVQGSGPSIEHALQQWIDDSRRASAELGRRLNGFDLPGAPEEST